MFRCGSPVTDGARRGFLLGPTQDGRMWTAMLYDQDGPRFVTLPTQEWERRAARREDEESREEI